MSWVTSRVAWGAALLSMFGLMRALRRLVPRGEEQELALYVAIGILVGAALMPTAFSRTPLPAHQAGLRKAVQFFAAGMVAALMTYLGTGLILAGLIGIAAAAVVAAVWPAPSPERA
ncbi:hypothetical protein ACQBAT_06050 [Ornithinimicrobium sp. Y1847]|uniref:hypothetical protein n=1 Tax=unclassified Ornithinimicrobium TaxID=2615080 RepID=UPI003B682438